MPPFNGAEHVFRAAPFSPQKSRGFAVERRRLIVADLTCRANMTRVASYCAAETDMMYIHTYKTDTQRLLGSKLRVIGVKIR